MTRIAHNRRRIGTSSAGKYERNTIEEPPEGGSDQERGYLPLQEPSDRPMLSDRLLQECDERSERAIAGDVTT